MTLPNWFSSVEAERVENSAGRFTVEADGAGRAGEVPTVVVPLDAVPLRAFGEREVVEESEMLEPRPFKFLAAMDAAPGVVREELVAEEYEDLLLWAVPCIVVQSSRGEEGALSLSFTDSEVRVLELRSQSSADSLTEASNCTPFCALNLSRVDFLNGMESTAPGCFAAELLEEEPLPVRSLPVPLVRPIPGDDEKGAGLFSPVAELEAFALAFAGVKMGPGAASEEWVAFHTLNRSNTFLTMDKSGP